MSFKCMCFFFEMLSYDGDSLVIVPWHEHKHRDEDWCEELECR